MIERVRLADAFARIDEYWAPKIVGELNGQQVKLAKFSGAFVWHQHDDEDEMFFVVRGRLRIRTPDGELTLEPGEFTIVPRGMQHQPVALDLECEVLLFEPASTVNTGDQVNERTRAAERL